MGFVKSPVKRKVEPIYAYMDAKTKMRFERYAADLGLDAANLLRLLLVRRVSRSPFSPKTIPAGPARSVKIPARLPGGQMRRLVKAVKTQPMSPCEVAAGEVFAEVEERSLARFLLT
jgi:hypothetical protein